MVFILPDGYTFIMGVSPKITQPKRIYKYSCI